MALRIAPNIVDHIKEIIIMGGGYLVNNITSGAEFNFWVDPEAAKIVMECGAPICVIAGCDTRGLCYAGRSRSDQAV